MLFKIQTVLVIAFLYIATSNVVDASSFLRGAAALPHLRHLFTADGDQHDGYKFTNGIVYPFLQWRHDRGLQNTTPDPTTAEPTVTMTAMETLVPTSTPTELAWEDLSLWEKIVFGTCTALILLVCWRFRKCAGRVLTASVLVSFFVFLALASSTDSQEQRLDEERKRKEYEMAAWMQQQQQQQQG
jgi:hypothetical protein